MFATLFSTLHYLIGLVFGILFLPVAYIQVFFPLGIALAVVIWPLAFIILCVATVTSIFWVPIAVFGFIGLSIVSFIFEVIASIVGSVREAIRQPPQHPQPFRDVPALPSGIPASRSDSVVAGHGLPATPGTDGASDLPSWLEKRFASLTQRGDTDDNDDLGLGLSMSQRGLRTYPPRSSIVGASSSSVNTNTTALGHSTSTINSLCSASNVNLSTAGPSSPASPITPTRRRSRTKSMSFEDGTRPGLSVSHSTTSMVTGSPRVSSQQGVNSSTTSLGSNAPSVAGSVEGAAESLRVGQLLNEASEDETTNH